MRMSNALPPLLKAKFMLPAPFPAVLARVSLAPHTPGSGVILDLALSVLEGGVFDLERIEHLADRRDARICHALFDFCERIGHIGDAECQTAIELLKPYAEMRKASTRH